MSDEPAKPDNLQLWNDLGKTNPAETKQFKRAGGFSGTAIKPMWVWQRLTEKFGPFGKGWGCEKPEFQLVNGQNSEILVYCTARGWWADEDASIKIGARHDVFGVGGDKVVTHIKANEQYKRPERWENDDEAFKKAYTDALMNAFKFIGVGADVHMGRFDDNKYVQQMEQEFNPPPEPEQPKRQPPPPLKGPIKTRAELRTACANFTRDLHGCGDQDMLDTVLRDNKALIDQVQDEHEFFWNGDGADFLGLAKEIEAAKTRVNEGN